MHARLKTLAAALAAISLCATPTMAVAAPTPIQPVSPLIAVSLYGTQASAQAVCAQGASAAGAAAAQGAVGCVLPATDVPAPMSTGMAPPPPTGNFGINWLLLGLGTLALLGGVATLFIDDDDEGSPVSAT
jgi:hypothetical protein